MYMSQQFYNLVIPTSVYTYKCMIILIVRDLHHIFT